MVNKAKIVLGLGFGDEGKGLTTDYLCLKDRYSIVIRFNGGHQAGHCVVTSDGKKHVFSNLGSGTFRDIPTYWSSYCTFSPVFFLEELQSLELKTKIYIDHDCPITTHYDILFNRASESSKGKNRNGSCGVGYGATIERQKNIETQFFFKDLFDLKIVKEKLNDIRKYYRYKINHETDYDFDDFSHETEDDFFINSTKLIIDLIKEGSVVAVAESEIFNNLNWSNYIFEGAQGILLDQNFGTFPHITKSNTTSQNALTIINRQIQKIEVEIFYVTRAYQTRHGAGPFRDSSSSFKLINNSSETNFLNDYQGAFKSNFLDINQLNYALNCDNIYSKSFSKNIVITCLDHIEGDEVFFFKNDKLMCTHYKNLYKELNCNFKSIIYSFSNCAEFIT